MKQKTFLTINMSEIYDELTLEQKSNILINGDFDTGYEVIDNFVDKELRQEVYDEIDEMVNDEGYDIISDYINQQLNNEVKNDEWLQNEIKEGLYIYLDFKIYNYLRDYNFTQNQSTKEIYNLILSFRKDVLNNIKQEV